MNELEILTQAVDRLPSQCQQQLAQAMKRMRETHQRRTNILNLVREALSQLRLDMKYLMFDLEATRRERDYFKTQLEK